MDPFLQNLVAHYSKVTQYAATRAYVKIRELHESYQGNPPKEITDSWKPLIDESAVAGMGEVLEKIPFHTISVSSEGAKEILVVGEAAPSVQGAFGNPKFPKVEMVSDAVEGTTPASQFMPGATSVVAIVEKPKNGSGIMSTPQDIHYMLKFIGPKQLNGVINLEKPHKENLKAAIKALGVRPSDLTQVIFDPVKKGREANIELVNAAEELGVKLIKINVGDFIPSVLAATNRDKAMIVATKGGFEEGIMAAAAAKAVGGFAQAIPFNKDNVSYKGNKAYTIDELVPCQPSRIAVIATFITDDNDWFNQPGIKEKDDSYHGKTLVITSKGIKITNFKFPIQ